MRFPRHIGMPIRRDYYCCLEKKRLSHHEWGIYKKYFPVSQSDRFIFRFNGDCFLMLREQPPHASLLLPSSRLFHPVWVLVNKNGTRNSDRENEEKSVTEPHFRDRKSVVSLLLRKKWRQAKRLPNFGARERARENGRKSKKENENVGRPDRKHTFL